MPPKLEIVKIPPGECSRAEAMEMMQASKASVERMVRDGRLRSTLIPRQGRREERVYNREDAKRIGREKQSRAILKPPSALAPRPAAAQSEAMIATALSMMAQILKRYEEPPALPAPAPPPLTVLEKLWLTLDEAVELSGLCRSDLLELCQAHVLIARKSPGWKIQRKSLEGFEE
jgi:hypothetical protein